MKPAMKKVPFHNTSDKVVYKGSVTIFPAQTRMVDICFVMTEQTPATDWKLEDFVKQNQDKEIAQLKDLTEEQFAQVQAHYQEHDAPKKLAPALEVEANERQAIKEADAYVNSLKAKTAEDLQAELLEVAEDAGRLALVQAELSARKDEE